MICPALSPAIAEIFLACSNCEWALRFATFQPACASNPITNYKKLSPIQQLQQSESQGSQVPGVCSDLCMILELLDALIADLKVTRQALRGPF